MASNTNASLIKNHKSLERLIIPAHILNNATMRTPLNHTIYSNYTLRYIFNLTEALSLSEIHLRPPVIIHNNNHSRG